MTIRNKFIFILPFLLVSLFSCTTVTPKNNRSTDSLYWVSNASRVNFDDLYELHEEISSPVDKKVSRYEGFYDQYREGIYEIPKNLQHGICLSPEAEWMIYFPPETQEKIKLLMNNIASWNTPKTNNEFRNLKIELRGMIEGKWLDILRDESRKPKWIIASGDNNVVSKSVSYKRLEFTVEQLDQRLKDSSYGNGLLPRIAIFRSQNDKQPDEQKPIYYSSFGDLAHSDLIKAIIQGNREPVLAIIKAVLKKFKSTDYYNSEKSIEGINFSANGKNAALVNSEERIKKAQDTPWYTQGWYAVRYFTTNGPRIGMRLITERAVNEKVNCLSKDEKYTLYLYDDTNENIGTATLSLKN